ncbi:hypothetical protein I7I53_06430 [Histoplasma capsulatum var. duboisii H88]|uniref:Uncharacterized protein n=1 Tax=Ajellomyces capsulatus (strain H88) TaxID=544711 RepID=A0A8A1LHD3_AJEC8|nr:hypothetical protein I7I53_06430 [Histoplasma capsulatum var. duboisii H88]
MLLQRRQLLVSVIYLFNLLFPLRHLTQLFKWVYRLLAMAMALYTCPAGVLDGYCQKQKKNWKICFH